MRSAARIAFAAVLMAFAPLSPGRAWAAAGSPDAPRQGDVPAASWSVSRVPVFQRAFGTNSLAVARRGFGDAPSVLPGLPAVPPLADLTGLAFSPPVLGPAAGAVSTRRTLDPGRSAEAAATTGSLARPGLLTNAPVDLPSHFLKEKIVAPHVSPDVTFGLNERTSVGLFGEVTQNAREDIRSNTVKEGRDVGAGVTLQYKFDSR